MLLFFVCADKVGVNNTGPQEVRLYNIQAARLYVIAVFIPNTKLCKCFRVMPPQPYMPHSLIEGMFVPFLLMKQK